MSVSALSYAERIPEWTPSTPVNTETAGGYDIYTYQDLELTYPGHWGKGFWIVTGEWRVTDNTNLGYAGFFLYNSVTELTHGVCGGYVYNTEWNQFSIIAGWQSDFASTMKLHLELAVLEGEAEDIVRVRNVRLAFIQFADAEGPKLAGRDVSTAGYHVTKMAWDYSAISPISIPEGNRTDLAVMTASELLLNPNTYIAFYHVNGLDCYGGANNAISMQPYIQFDDNTYSLLRGRAYMRPEPGFYPSYGWIDHTGTSTGTITQRIVLGNAGPYNAVFDLYGGWFMMLMVYKDDSYRGEVTTQETQPLGSDTDDSFQVSNYFDTMSRFLVFAAGRERASDPVGKAKITVSLEGETLFQANTIFRDANTDPLADHGLSTSSWFAFGNKPMKGALTNPSDGNTALALLDYTREGLDEETATYPTRFGPTSYMGMKLERDYVNSAHKIANAAISGVSGSFTWSNLSNLYSANVTHWSYQMPSATASQNHYLKVTGFGFDEFIPEGSEIGYIWMHPVYMRTEAEGGAIVWDDVKMVVANTAVGASVAWATPWPTDWQYVGPDINFGVSTYWTFDNTPAEGGSATRNGLWNYKPTAEQVRASNFGFQMRCRATSGSPKAYVAYVACVVYFRAPGETFMRSISSTASLRATAVSEERSIVQSIRSASATLTGGVTKTASVVNSVAGTITATASSTVKGILNRVLPVSAPVTSGVKNVIALRSVNVSANAALKKAATTASVVAGTITATAVSGVKTTTKNIRTLVGAFPDISAAITKAVASVSVSTTAIGRSKSPTRNELSDIIGL